MNLLNTTIIIVILILLILITFVNKNKTIGYIFNTNLDNINTRDESDLGNKVYSNTEIDSPENKDNSKNRDIDNLNKIINEEKDNLSHSDLLKIFRLILEKYQFSNSRFLLLKKKTYFFLKNYSLNCIDNDYKYLNGLNVDQHTKRFYLITLIIYFFILNQNLKTKEDVLKDFFDQNGDVYTILLSNNYVFDYNNQILLTIPHDRNNIITRLELMEIFSILKKKKNLISILDIINIGKYYNQLNYQCLTYNNSRFKKYCKYLQDNDSQLSYYAEINNLLNYSSKRKNNEVGNRYLRNKNWGVPRQWIDKYGPNYLLSYY